MAGIGGRKEGLGYDVGSRPLRLAGKVSIEQDAADNWKPSKKKSCERIDGIVALIMGLDLASRTVETRSIYSTPGNLAL